MKVWVLEKFASPTELIKTLIDMIEMVESSRSSCSAGDSQKLDKGLDQFVYFSSKISKNGLRRLSLLNKEQRNNINIYLSIQSLTEINV